MILDERSEFADATALNTGGAGTYLIGDVMDLQGPTIGHGSGMNVTRDLGFDDNMWLVIQVDTTATSGGLATAVFTLASDNTASIATDGSATAHFATGAIPVASLTAGTIVACVKLPSGSYERYLGILQTTGTAAFTAGKVNAFLTSDPARYRAYADNV